MAPLRPRLLSRWVLLVGASMLGVSCTGLELNPQPDLPGAANGMTAVPGTTGMGSIPTGNDIGFEMGSAGATATATGSSVLPDGTTVPTTGAGGASSGAVATGAPGFGGTSPIGAGQAGGGPIVGAGGTTGVATGGSATAAGGASAGGASASGGAESGGAGGEDSGGAGGMAGAGGAGGAGGASPMVSVAACQEYESQDIACFDPAVIIDSVIYSSGEVRGGYFADAECTEPLGAIEKTLQAPGVMRGTLQNTTLECLFEVGAPYAGQLYTNSESDDCATVAESSAIYDGLNLYHIGAAFEGELCE